MPPKLSCTNPPPRPHAPRWPSTAPRARERARWTVTSPGLVGEATPPDQTGDASKRMGGSPSSWPGGGGCTSEMYASRSGVREPQRRPRGFGTHPINRFTTQKKRSTARCVWRRCPDNSVTRRAATEIRDNDQPYPFRVSFDFPSVCCDLSHRVAVRELPPSCFEMYGTTAARQVPASNSTILPHNSNVSPDVALRGTRHPSPVETSYALQTWACLMNIMNKK